MAGSALAVLFAGASLLLGQAATPLPVLRAIRQVHTLAPAEAVRGYPVHLSRAQVTFYDPTISCLFLMDATDGIFVDFRGQTPPQLRPGDIVRVDAVSGPGKVNPVLVRASFHLLEHASLPSAPLVSFDQVLSGAWDSRWIALEGVVRSVRRPSEMTAYAGETGFGSSNVILTLASGPDLIDVITPAPPSIHAASLVDARVQVRAAVGSRFNQRSQLIGVHVYMPDIAYVKILEPPPSDPFSLPVSTTAGVMRRSLLAPGHRVRVQGVVTWARDSQFALMDAVHGIFIYTDTPARVQVGDRLDVVGFPSMNAHTAVLEDAIDRRLGASRVPPAVALTAAQALTGDHDAEPVQVEGDLVYKSRTPGEEILLLTENGSTFSATLPANVSGRFDSLQPGSRLRVTGICYIEVTPAKTPRAVRILLQSPADIVVLSRPSWWTARNTLILAVLLLAAVAVVIAWNTGLRRRVRSQTRMIRDQLDVAQSLRRQAEAAHREKSESLANVLSLQRDLLTAQEKLRHQATHDVLTGLWNRRALLEHLETELARCLRTHASVGILMLDVDHFKPVNDTLGHLAGDEVLKEIAQRLTQATRSYDLVGRYGGEEFLIVLPTCDRRQTEASAERIRHAIAATPFQAAGTAVTLTVSIGATVAPEWAHTETEILSLADLALYQAKSAGRNCTVLRTSFAEAHAPTT